MASHGSFAGFVARLGTSIYYRAEHHGTPVPPRGPVLLVANHPNSLLDPMLVLATARRPVRFLAKAPLFTDAKVGWLVRGFGSIPVYRASDDPSQVGRNAEMFRAVHAALADGDAVAIFPEGISHSEPSLAPLKTGAARIALGAAATLGHSFPVIPVGLVFRDKERFRSRAQVLTGPPVEWDDLATRRVEDEKAVRFLTERIARSLEKVTQNLESWLDQPIVDTAMAIWAAERREDVGAEEEASRRDATVAFLARVREARDPEGLALSRDVLRHARRLRRLRLAPRDLHADAGLGTAAKWSVARLPLVMPLPAALAAVTLVIFWVPWWITGVVVGRLRLAPDTRATWKLMLGAVIYLLWIVLAAIVVGALTTWHVGVVTLLALPPFGILGLWIREHWRGSWQDLRRWVLLRGRRTLVRKLHNEQRHLHTRLTSLVSRLTSPDFA